MTEKVRRWKIMRKGWEGKDQGRKIMEEGRKGDDGGMRAGR